MRSSYIGKGKKEGRSVTITDEFRIASGYGSVWVVLLLGGDDACTHLVIRFCFRHSLNSAQRKEHLWLASREKAHGRESNSTNALTCCANKKAPTFMPRLLPNLASMSTLNIIGNRGNQDFNFAAQFAFAPSIYEKYHFHFSEATHLQNYFSSGRYQWKFFLQFSFHCIKHF
ncbi:TPA: hypothetical protein HML98_17750 [Escherichia coli]|nr:hypothetical protein [Escherichia coli]